VSKHCGGAPGAAAAAVVHPYLSCVFVILCNELNFLLPGVPGRARSAVCDGPKLRHRQTEVVNLYIRFHSWFISFPFLVSKHCGGAPGAAAAAAVHPYLSCIFVILCNELNFLLPGVPGRARSAVCDGPELRHRQTEVVNLYIRFHSWFISFPFLVGRKLQCQILSRGMVCSRQPRSFQGVHPHGRLDGFRGSFI